MLIHEKEQLALRPFTLSIDKMVLPEPMSFLGQTVCRYNNLCIEWVKGRKKEEKRVNGQDLLDEKDIGFSSSEKSCSS